MSDGPDDDNSGDASLIRADARATTMGQNRRLGRRVVRRLRGPGDDDDFADWEWCDPDGELYDGVLYAEASEDDARTASGHS
jgi:hypothetical protein